VLLREGPSELLLRGGGKGTAGFGSGFGRCYLSKKGLRGELPSSLGFWRSLKRLGRKLPDESNQKLRGKKIVPFEVVAVGGGKFWERKGGSRHSYPGGEHVVLLVQREGNRRVTSGALLQKKEKKQSRPASIQYVGGGREKIQTKSDLGTRPPVGEKKGDVPAVAEKGTADVAGGKKRKNCQGKK